MSSQFKNELQRLKKTLDDFKFFREPYSTNHSAIYTKNVWSVSYEIDRDEYGFGYWVWVSNGVKTERRHLKDRFDMKKFTEQLERMQKEHGFKVPLQLVEDFKRTLNLSPSL
jgi:hypothetical protein